MSFTEYLQNQIKSQPIRARLATSAKRYDPVVLMLDLASEQLAGSTMAEISTVLYAKAMQWAGYSRDEKIAYLEFLLERDGRLADFMKRISEISDGKDWGDIRNQPLVSKALASKVASEFYPELFPDSKAFNEVRIEECIKENDRVSQMLDLIQRKSGKKNVIFILDEVGQYIASRDDLILNLDGLAKNVKNLGQGHCWIVATAQQTLTEDDPRAATLTPKLFKLKDRFPISIDLEASDIKEICYRRLLGKSREGNEVLEKIFVERGAQLKFATELKNAGYYKTELDKEGFIKFYPFLPHHFDILLQLLARLARTRGGIGLRSAIKVIQDILVSSGKPSSSKGTLSDEEVGKLANAVVFYDTLHADIEKPFPYIVSGVEKIRKIFGDSSLQLDTAKTIALLQILDDFPVSRENVAAMIHPSVDSPALFDAVNDVVDELLSEESIPLNEVDDNLRFMSDAVIDLEKVKKSIIPRSADTNAIKNGALREIFTPLPTVKLQGTRTVNAGLKVHIAERIVSLAGDREPIQIVCEFIPEAEYEDNKKKAIISSQQQSNANNVFLLGREEKEVDDLIVEIYRCQEIFRLYRNKAADKEVDEYLRAQDQRARSLLATLNERIKRSLVQGSLIFRGKPRAVAELDAEVAIATRKFLNDVAAEVFNRFNEAPVNAESLVAERFLKTEKLDKISSNDDPLSLVRKDGSASIIDTNHKAIISIKDYLEDRGLVDGRRLLDDFFSPPYGWFKDTTRYIVAAMLVAGIVKLRIAGEDVTVRGEVAINNLKNTNSFNKMGITLRDVPPDLGILSRARERILNLTGEEVLPLEEEISGYVAKHFPDLQQEYADLAIRLKNLGLEGHEKALSVQENLAEILKGDASDAAVRLGGEECPFYENLCWAKEVKHAFDNGIEDIIKQGNTIIQEIPKLPDYEILGELIVTTRADRDSLNDYIQREDFYAYMTNIQGFISEIEGEIQKAASHYLSKQRGEIARKKEHLQGLPEWGLLSADDQRRIGEELDAIEIDAELSLDGLKKLINSELEIASKLKTVEEEIYKLAKGYEEEGNNIIDIDIVVPKTITSKVELDDLIERIEELKQQLEPGIKLRITWR